MTDNEIVKALECCISPSTALACFKCPMVKNKECNGSNTNVNKLVVENALALINRQKAEIERKTTECERLEIYMDELVKQRLNQAKSEAYRELAEKLKENTLEVDVSYGYGKEHYTEVVAVVEIDNTLKELTEEKRNVEH